MGEVVDFNTGLPIKVGRITKRKDTVTLIESLYQRRHQVGDLILIYNDKLHGNIGFGLACRDDLERRILHTYLNDYMILYSDITLDDD